MSKIMILASMVAVATSGHSELPVQNMNSGGYIIANDNPKSPVKFRTDYPRDPTEKYFDVYAGPISTRYGEVFWKGCPPAPIPDDIVKKYDGKVIAITGYEQDQVIKGENGKPDQSVPIYWAYNHHYVAWLKGKDATMVELDGTDESITGHPLKMNAVTIDDPNPDSVIPTSQFFSEGNGGESRKSYHGYPKGTAQLLESPTDFVITPMQIDTWNRNTSYGDPFVPGPESKASLAPRTGPDAIYSGHLECPCTDRIVKTIEQTYATQTTGACAVNVNSSEMCFASVASVGMDPYAVVANVTVDSPTLPSGCSSVAHGPNNVTVYYNANKGGDVKCGAGSNGIVSGSTTAIVTFALALDPSGNGGAGKATMTLTGPSDVWFGVGLGATVMKDTPNAIIVLPNGTVFEQKLADQSPGTTLPMSLTVVSNTVTNTTRAVVVTRVFKGKTSGHYTFDPTASTVNFINAVGRTPVFAYHQSRGAAVLHLSLQGAPTCICNTGIQGYIASDMNPQKAPFHKNCLPEPYADLQQLRNPTCTIEQYAGGLKCCTSGNILLDKDQNPWPENILTYYMKWRFWYQDYTPATNATPASHENMVRFFRQTEAQAGEYDIVQAPKGTKPEDTVYQITGHFQVKDGVSPCNPRTSPHCTGTDGAGIMLRYSSCHCHAPACISCELWNADTGELICRQVPVVGNSTTATSDNPYDEKGYIAIPPCLYGPAEEGLLPAPFLSYDTNLTSIKRNNNTYGHYGEMAMWQMRGTQAYMPAKQ